MTKKIKRQTMVFCLLFIGGTAFSQQTPIYSTNAEKEAWIQEHPEEYKKLLERSQTVSATAVNVPAEEASTTTSEQNSTSGNAGTGTSITDLPGFPVFVNTGDPIGDDARYEAAKVKWFAENKRLVRKFYRNNN